MQRIIFVAVVAFLATALGCQQKAESESQAVVETPPPAAPVVTPSTSERPTDAELYAFKLYHHAVYLETTAKQAGGTNKLFHTTKLPTEGTDPVVTPALDHLYTKAVIDLSFGPVVVEIPEVEKDRYFSIQIADQGHYTIYEEIHPVGKYVFVRKGMDWEVPEGATVIESPGDYPHLFVRIQARNTEDLPNIPPIQQSIKIIAAGSEAELVVENPIQFTLDTHDVYEQNLEYLESAANFSADDYQRVSDYIGAVAPKFSVTGNTGMFGPIDSAEPHSNDPEYRAAAMVGHLGFPIHHAYYAPYFTNCKDEVLSGNKTEVFTFSYEPEGVELFWSITRYSALTRNTIPGKNDLFNAYNTLPDANGNIIVTFSVDDPDDGTYWMPVNVGEPYYFVARYYKPDLNNIPQKPCN
ncbi:MAG: DUF1254 domain-containing protein [Proteobacteria bacterium]|nr:DUF1254 domain-containing protein [Pseudomonadota bacterium]